MTVRLTSVGNIRNCASTSIVINIFLCTGATTCAFPGTQDLTNLITGVISTPVYIWNAGQNRLEGLTNSNTTIGLAFPMIDITIDDVGLTAVLDTLTGDYNVRARITCYNAPTCGSTSTNGVDVDGTSQIDCQLETTLFSSI